MHLNLSCDHIMLQTKLKTIKLIGYGSTVSFGNNSTTTATTNTSTTTTVSNQELLLQEKDMRCMSPEQTGRIKNYDHIDYRSDFYTIGVIFYKMLTGKYPFDFDSSKDTSLLDIIHYHIYKDPTSITICNPNMPTILCDMVCKLMSKNAEDRYVSANGVMHDIDLMLSEYNDGNVELSNVTLAQHDGNNLSSSTKTTLATTATTNNNDMGNSCYFTLPKKLYGRQLEYKVLSNILQNKINIHSYAEYIMIKGHSGTGKSALVNELCKDIARRNGFCLHGKFDRPMMDHHNYNNNDTSSLTNSRYNLTLFIC